MITTIQEKSTFNRVKEFVQNHPFLAATAVTGTALTVIGLNAGYTAWVQVKLTQCCQDKGLSKCVPGPTINKFSYVGKAILQAMIDPVTSTTSSIYAAGSYAFATAKDGVVNGFSKAKEGVVDGFSRAKEGVVDGFSRAKEAVPSASEIYNTTTHYARSASDSLKQEVSNVASYIGNMRITGLAREALSSIGSLFSPARPMGEYNLNSTNTCKI